MFGSLFEHLTIPLEMYNTPEITVIRGPDSRSGQLEQVLKASAD